MAQLQQRFTGRRDADSPADAVKDRFAEFFFEQENLPADRRLRDVELLAGGCERAGLGYRTDDLELTQIHRSKLT